MRRYGRLLVVVLPVLLGLAALLVVRLAWQPETVLVFKVGVGVALCFAGLLTTWP